ncbi:MAG: substrate-binding domain-containing protein [Dorea sp.]|nr:substrate-binding domain-containing protein [Dorea sp.]
MKRWTKFTSLIVMAALLVCGCGSRPDENLQPEESIVHEGEVEYPDYQPKLDRLKPEAYGQVSDLNLAPGTYISILGKDSKGAFWKEVQAGIKQAQDDINANLGYEGKDKIRVNYNAPDDPTNVDQQINLLDLELDLYPSALAISILDVQGCEVQFDLAYQNGIPIVAFDSGSNYGGFSARVATNNEKAARKCADKMAEAAGEKGQIVIFAHESGSESAMDRVKAFKKQIKEKYPDMKVASVIYLDKMDKIKEKMLKKIAKGKYQRKDASGKAIDEKDAELTIADISDADVEDYVISTKKNLTGCYATNGDTIMHTLEVLERNGYENLPVLGFDISEQVLEKVREGKVTGVILQNPFGMGYATVVAAARSALGMSNQDYVDTKYEWVTKDNIDTEEIQSLIY